MSTIRFKAKLSTIGSWTILRLPNSASSKLPSRSQVIVEGTINGHQIQTPLEPDGTLGHWFKVDDHLLKAINAVAGDSVTMAIDITKDWPEPNVPADLQKAISADKHAYNLWKIITPMARWEWIRWTRSTGSEETRKRRIEVAISKLKDGKRRPCCWNRNLCTEPLVSKNGVLLESN